MIALLTFPLRLALHFWECSQPMTGAEWALRYPARVTIYADEAEERAA